ncbi:helix-turn-helix transcriptional regulator [Desulfurivibrio alkaliphilus]|uniref:Phage transcriptional regulator, AlpA n=1 Tax=Desulfurivibrio alkaliphilus (strain DSM 19089 / UNIQEM U267 / AHT2) TaxID=589865 RepID=D6Z5I3_DESAT|nr:phage transcriptional regulator, AlpA [Desulfurivibrio alkaliphilus AHT 2]
MDQATHLTPRHTTQAGVNNQPPAPLQLERVREVCARTGIPRSSLYDLLKKGEFPQPVKLGTGKRSQTAFVSHEIDAWIESRMAARQGKEVGQ